MHKLQFAEVTGVKYFGSMLYSHMHGDMFAKYTRCILCLLLYSYQSIPHVELQTLSMKVISTSHVTYSGTMTALIMCVCECIVPVVIWQRTSLFRG